MITRAASRRPAAGQIFNSECYFKWFKTIWNSTKSKGSFWWLLTSGISEGNFQTFPDDPYSWGQKSSSTRTLTSGARITIPASTSPRHSSSEITTVNSAISTATFHTTSKVFTSSELDTTTSYAQDISTRTSHQTSPVRIASSSSLQPPHPTESTISG